jgi:CMP-N-acetylneuraminic acid synthetase
MADHTATPTCLAVIPARGGSTRLPGKNLRPFRGRPVIGYTIEAALESGLFRSVVVTTDSGAIADVARAFGAEVPFLRDSRLSDEVTPVSLATVDALERTDPAEAVRYVAQLLPNCPLRTAEDIRESFLAFSQSGVGSQLSVTQFGWQNPWWSFRRAGNGVLHPVFEEMVTQRGQDLPELFCISGAIWWATAEVLRRDRTYHVPGRTGWVMPWQRGIDIDTEDDWALAELLFEQALAGAEPR